MRRAILVCLAMILGGLTTAHAEGGFFVGVEAGRSESEIDKTDFTFGPGTVRGDGKATGFRLSAGYQFNRYLAVEGGYVNFGEFSIDGVPYACGEEDSCTLDIRSESHGLLVNVVGSWPFGEHWAVNGRAGLAQISGKTRQRDPENSSSSQSFDDESTGFVFGAGVSYAISDQLETELAWLRFEQVGFGLSVGGGAVAMDFGHSELLTLGLKYRF